MEVVATRALRFSEARTTYIIPFIIISNILIVLTTEPDYYYEQYTNSPYYRTRLYIYIFAKRIRNLKK